VTIVLKVGGASTAGVAAALEALRSSGARVCVVHGAGPQISEEMARRSLVPQFVEGRRVTTAEVLEVVRESLAVVNAAVCAAIGPDALPLAGDEIGLEADLVPELGFVGRAVPSAPPAVLTALAAGLVPVVTPLARGPLNVGPLNVGPLNVGPLNVNADEAASALAVGIGAAGIRFLTDVPGVYHEGRFVQTIAARHAQALVEGGAFDGGIVPKLLAAASAARSGVAAEIGMTAVTA
jgi:acetylglutamate kinase